MSSDQKLREDLLDAKNHSERQFHHLTSNFYIIRSALRYYSVKTGKTFTATSIADSFPVAVSVAGSSLNVLNEIGVIQKRNESSSADRYMPRETDMELLERVEKILLENYEIEEYR